MTKGFYDKYDVVKKDGNTDPDADYFVLRLDNDQHARIAAYHYALSVKDDNPNLAFDLQRKIIKYERNGDKRSDKESNVHETSS